MSGEGMPYGTPSQLALADEIQAAADNPTGPLHVYGYPDWDSPQAYVRDGLRESKVTARVLDFVRAGVACWESSARDGSRVPVRLTPEGREWLARCRSRDAAAEELRKARRGAL